MSDSDVDSILADALETASDAYVIYSKAGRLIACNQRFKDLYGYPDDLITSETMVSDLIKYDRDHGLVATGKEAPHVIEHIQKKEPYRDLPRRNYILDLDDGRFISIREHDTKDGSVVSIQRDITELKKQEEAARKNAELFEAAFNATSNVCTLTELETGVFIDVNTAWCEATGFKREEAIGNTATSVGAWGAGFDRKKFITDVRENPKLRDYAVTITRKNGEIRQWLLNTDVLEISDKRCLFLSCRDMTDHLKAEAELQRNQKRFMDFSAASSDWFWETDHLLRHTYISPAVEKTSGVSSSEYIGATIEEVLGPSAQNQAAVRRMFEMMSDKKPFKDLVVYRFQRKTGEKRWTRISGIPFYEDDGKFAGFRGNSSDITEQIRLEDRLKESQRLEAVGQLSGGVAHDFNNLLAVIQGNAEVIQEALGEDNPELTHHLDAIMRASHKGANLTQNMLAFSRSQMLSPSAFRMDEFVREVLPSVERMMGPGITIRIDTDKDIWICQADQTKLESVLMNICMNASDAMSAEGTLNIEIRNRDVDENYALMEKDVLPGQYVSLIVSDTGEGIPPERLPHIVEPFYTTKDVGKGSGLGLSMVYGFVRQSAGSLSIYSEVGIGTTVRLLLPVIPPTNVSQEVNDTLDV